MTFNFTEATAYRKKWLSGMFQELLQSATVAEKIMAVDTSDVKYIENPYADAGVVTQQSPLGTYNIDAFAVTADTLTVSDEFIWSEHVFTFEQIAAVVDVKGSRIKEAMAKMATAVDKYALNALANGATGAYSTPAGGFTRDNVPEILAKLSEKFAGYSEDFNGKYIVIEQTDLGGFIQAGMTNGFNFADTFLKNGYVGTLAFGGFDVYVKTSGTFVTATLGTLSATNAGKRLAGIKRLATLARPNGRMAWEEKQVSGKLGWELAMGVYAGVKVWTQKAALTVLITIA
jgi:hypothetical protein